MKKNFTLIYFSGCPNLPIARQALTETCPGDFNEINQGDLEEKNPFRRYSSPTILYNETIVIGSEAGDSSCSLLNISLDDLKNKIQKTMEGI